MILASVSGLVIGEEVLVGGDFSIIISDRDEVAFVVEAVESVFLVADVVDEENAVEVVDFVEKGASEEAFGFEADFVAVFEEGFDFGFAGAADAAIDLGDREATLIVSLDFAFGADDFGVNEGSEMTVLLVVKVVADDNDALVDAELGRSHGGREFIRVLFFPVERTFNHIRNNRAGFVGDLANFGGFGAETGVGGGNNWFHCIYYIIVGTAGQGRRRSRVGRRKV